MRASGETKSFMADGKGGKDEGRCSECGRKLMTVKDHVPKGDSLVCASCYHSMVYGLRIGGVEVFE